MGSSSISVLLLLASAAAFFSLATPIDTIDQAASISGNQTLVSAGGVFQLGFFSPGDGADGDRKYLGIWYAKVPGPTIVWVANRQSPVINSPGELKLSPDGRLLIIDSRNATIWSSAEPSTSITTLASARLFDDGNFVLSSDGSGSPGSVAWQSFDYPTDTLLPGMKLGVDNKAGITRNITSWSSPTDPSPGPYTFKLVTGGLPQFFLFRGPTTRIYTSGPWNGEMLTGVPYLKSQDFGFTVVSSPDETYYTYSIRNASLLSRFMVDGTSGQLKRFVWSSGAWSNFWYYPSEPCDGYAKCGAFGYCDSTLSQLCSCLPGFVPRSPEQWSLRDTSGGCVRSTNHYQSCIDGGGGGGDGFWVVNQMKLPDATNATVYAGMTLEQCRVVCLNNCSCRAYAAANVHGAVSSGCVIWGVDLLDMRQYSISVQDVYIRLAQSDIDALKTAEDEGKRRLLGWQKRFEIILGIARGLLYLHEDSSGYMSPEYAMDGLFSMKSDVYSLGVIVLEIVTGKKNRGFYDPELDLNLLGYAYMLWKEGRSVELVDNVMDGGFNNSEVLRCIQVALLCVDVQPRNRPTMSSVFMMLSSENATVPVPNEPGVNNGKNTSDTESSSYGFTTNSHSRHLLLGLFFCWRSWGMAARLEEPERWWPCVQLVAGVAAGAWLAGGSGWRRQWRVLAGSAHGKVWSSGDGAARHEGSGGAWATADGAD
nr:unnamed protein product [Digitaria exilis]